MDDFKVYLSLASESSRTKQLNALERLGFEILKQERNFFLIRGLEEDVTALEEFEWVYSVESRNVGPRKKPKIPLPNPIYIPKPTPLSPTPSSPGSHIITLSKGKTTLKIYRVIIESFGLKVIDMTSETFIVTGLDSILSELKIKNNWISSITLYEPPETNL
jgi:hypothetical protein